MTVETCRIIPTFSDHNNFIIAGMPALSTAKTFITFQMQVQNIHSIIIRFTLMNNGYIQRLRH